MRKRGLRCLCYNPYVPQQKRKLILITGIPGTGKTFYGESFAQQFGFTHYNLEEASTRSSFLSNPPEFMEEILRKGEDAVVTWGFGPNKLEIGLVGQFKAKGFMLVWFDGSRPAALREFIKRGTVPEECFYAQMWRIENSKVIEAIKPCIINTFDENDKFKKGAAVLDEIERGT